MKNDGKPINYERSSQYCHSDLHFNTGQFKIITSCKYLKKFKICMRMPAYLNVYYCLRTFFISFFLWFYKHFSNYLFNYYHNLIFISSFNIKMSVYCILSVNKILPPCFDYLRQYCSKVKKQKKCMKHLLYIDIETWSLNQKKSNFHRYKFIEIELKIYCKTFSMSQNTLPNNYNKIT